MYNWQELAELPETELARVDLAEINLACAVGLPGAEKLAVPACSEKLNTWAERVRRETARHYSRFAAKPAEFRYSKAYFRTIMLVTVLQQDFGVRYNPQRIHQPEFRDCRDLFIHGCIFGDGGTCASMPVLYVVVGRRLGYPLRLVHAKAHVFARWDDPEGRHPVGADRLNIEATNQGMHSFPDEYYHSWPLPLSPEELGCGGYLQSLTPREELGSFLASRGHCLLDNGRLREAWEAYRAATTLAPKDPYYGAFAEQAKRRSVQAAAWGKAMAQQQMANIERARASGSAPRPFGFR